MIIKSLKVKNFKSFQNIDIQLGQFNVLIGANASGKSNFIQIFRFLKHIAENGLEYAVSMQGGIQYLRNMAPDAGRVMSFEVSFYDIASFRLPKELGINIDSVVYVFQLEIGRNDYKVVSDRVVINGQYVSLGSKDKRSLGYFQYNITNHNGKITSHFKKPDGVEEITQMNSWIPLQIKEKGLGKKEILLHQIFYMLSMTDLNRSISLFDFDPKLPKKAVPISGDSQLQEDGNNLVLSLQSVLGEKKKRDRFNQIMNNILPFVEKYEIEKMSDKSVYFSLKESWFARRKIPASLISDGTIAITLLTLALYFYNNDITIIEEPERNIHPYLIDRIAAMMLDASQQAQIITTTHNPELIKNVPVENIILVQRNEKGVSELSRPADNQTIKKFLKNNLGIADLYVQNMLEVK